MCIAPELNVQLNPCIDEECRHPIKFMNEGNNLRIYLEICLV